MPAKRKSAARFSPAPKCASASPSTTVIADTASDDGLTIKHGMMVIVVMAGVAFITAAVISNKHRLTERV